MLVLLAGLAISPVHAGFRSPWTNGERGEDVGWVERTETQPGN